VKILKIFNSKQIRTAAIGSLTIKFLSAFFALINGILLANLLSVQEFGIYILAFTTITVISIPVSLGLPHLITRYISKYEVTKNLSAIKGLLIRTNQFVLLSSLLAGLIALVLYVVWWKNYPSNVVATFWYAFILLPLLVFGSLRAATLRGLKFVILGQMPDTFLRNLFFSFTLLWVTFYEQDMTPQRAMIFHCIAAAIAFFIGYLFLKQKLLNQLRKIKPIFLSRLWLREAIPFSVISGVQVIKSKFLTYVLAGFVGIEAVAIFDVAQRGAALVSFTVDALNMAISPYISSDFERNNKESMQRIVKKTARIIFVFSIPIAFLFIILGKPIIGFLFGSEYELSYLPLVIICIGHIVNAISGPLLAVMNMTGNQRFLSKNQIQMMFLSALISFPFIYYYDVIGAALVFSIVFIIQDLILVFFIKKKLNVNTTIF
jgi:O-antigen/teichoic acid export membrane protein